MEPAVRPTRKIRLRIIPVIGYIVVAIGLAWFFELQATTTVIFVRHAETEGSIADGADPPLSARGRQRAQLLAEFLSDVDVVSSVDAIYATTTLRTQQTAAPLIERLGQQLNIDDPYLVERFMHPGEFPKQEKILKIAQIDPLRVEVYAPVALLGKITVGSTAYVKPEPPVPGEYAAKVTVVDRVVDAASGTFGVRLELPNHELKLPAGLKCTVRFGKNNKE